GSVLPNLFEEYVERVRENGEVLSLAEFFGVVVELEENAGDLEEMLEVVELVSRRALYGLAQVVVDGLLDPPYQTRDIPLNTHCALLRWAAVSWTVKRAEVELQAVLALQDAQHSY